MLLHAWLCVSFSLSLSLYIYVCIFLLLILLRDHVRFLRDGLDDFFSMKNF